MLAYSRTGGSLRYWSDTQRCRGDLFGTYGGRGQSRWLRTADGFAVSGQLVAAWVKKTPTRAEQPFDTIVDGHAPGEAPQPLTLNHPASNPSCSSSWGSFFSGYRSAAKMIPGLS